MATKTPRTRVQEYLESVGTEKDVHRTQRRRSGAPDPEAEGSNPAGAAPESAGKKQGKKGVLAQATAIRSSLRIRQNARNAAGNDSEPDVTASPRHIVIHFPFD